MIYFLQNVNGGTVKIGFTDNLNARCKQIEAYYGCPLAILATMKGDRETEREIHERFANLRFGRTEQFRPAVDLMAFIGRPLLVGANPDAVEAMPPIPDERTAVIHLKGSVAYAEWLERFHRETHIPKTTLVRLGLADLAKKLKFEAPPEL